MNTYEDSNVPLEFSRWAALAARMLPLDRVEREELREREGIEQNVWLASDAGWTKALSEEIARGDLRRAEQYAALCGAALAGRTPQAACPIEGSSAPTAPLDETLPATNVEPIWPFARPGPVPPGAPFTPPILPATPRPEHRVGSAAGQLDETRSAVEVPPFSLPFVASNHPGDSK